METLQIISIIAVTAVIVAIILIVTGSSSEEIKTPDTNIQGTIGNNIITINKIGEYNKEEDDEIDGFHLVEKPYITEHIKSVIFSEN